MTLYPYATDIFNNQNGVGSPLQIEQASLLKARSV